MAWPIGGLAQFALVSNTEASDIPLVEQSSNCVTTIMTDQNEQHEAKGRSPVGTGDRIHLLRQGLTQDPESPDLLYDLAAALAAEGLSTEAAQVHGRAYTIQPRSAVLRAGGLAAATAEEIRRVRDYGVALIGLGLVDTATIASLAEAEVRLGHTAAVRRLVDYEKFFRSSWLAAPTAEPRDVFLATLADEIRSNLVFYDRPDKRAIRNAWRHNGLLSSSQPASRALACALRSAVDEYISGLPRDASHPFNASTPSSYTLRGWGLVSNGASHHELHIHAQGWLSGVFYVVQPPVSLNSETRRAWLRLGPPPGVSSGLGWDEQWVEPSPGRLVLMPSYFYHGTHPMEAEEERICVAFDVIPDRKIAPRRSGQPSAE